MDYQVTVRYTTETTPLLARRAYWRIFGWKALAAYVLLATNHSSVAGRRRRFQSPTRCAAQRAWIEYHWQRLSL